MFMIYLFTSNLLNEEQKERTDHKDQSFSMLYIYVEFRCTRIIG